MPTVSRKGEAMPSSPIRKLVPFAENAERAGKKVFYLNIGQPDIHTPEVAQQAIKDADIPVLAYKARGYLYTFMFSKQKQILHGNK